MRVEPSWLGLVSLWKKPQKILLPLLPWEDPAQKNRRWPSMSQALTKHKIYHCLNLGCPSIWTIRNKCLLFHSPGRQCFCYSSLNGLRQPATIFHPDSGNSLFPGSQFAPFMPYNYFTNQYGLYNMWTRLHDFPPVLTWTPPKIDLDSEILVKVIHLGGDPRKHWKWSVIEKRRDAISVLNKLSLCQLKLISELWGIVKIHTQNYLPRDKETGVFIHQLPIVIGCRLLSSER